LLEKAYLDCLAIELAEAGITTDGSCLALRYKSVFVENAYRID
jgi:hypothetical protein